MSNDSVTVVSSKGYFERLAESIGGMLLGIVMFFGSFFVLWWNEGNVVAERKAFDEMQKAYVEIDATSPQQANNNKLIHASNHLVSSEKLGDKLFLKPGNYLKISRSVEMYQWVEHSESKTEKQTGGSEKTTTTYTYKKDWASGRVDSNKFHETKGHENPSLAVEPENFSVSNATFGAFDGHPILSKLSNWEDLSATPELLATAENISGGKIYKRKSANASGDQIGDVRVSYEVIKPGTYSIMARQVGGKTFENYVTKNGKSKFLVDVGSHSPQNMLESARNDANTMAMILRFVGFAVMWIGLALVFSPMATLLDVLPFLGSVGRFAIGAVSFIASAVLSATTILIAMIAHHPVALAVILLGTLGIFAGLYFKNQKNKVATMPNNQNQSNGPNSRAA